VEFAVVMPIFVLMVFGMIEIGRAVMVQQILVNASREGARLGVLDGTTDTEVRTRVNEYLQAASLPAATTDQISFPQGNPQDVDYGDAVEVKVQLGFGQVTWLATPIYLGGKTLEASTVMRRETLQ
jgi:Flp pilus assembly protein TadG